MDGSFIPLTTNINNHHTCRKFFDSSGSLSLVFGLTTEESLLMHNISAKADSGSRRVGI